MYFAHTGLTIAAPAIEPVTLDEFCEYGRIDEPSDRALVTAQIAAARQQIEDATGRLLISRTVTAYYDKWPKMTAQDAAIIHLPRSPVSAVATVKYYDGDNTLTTWAASNYDTDLRAEPARITLGYGSTWPTLRSRTNAIEIAFTAGYGATAASCPAALRIAIMAVALASYENREGHLNSAFELRDNRAVQALIASYKIGGVT